MHPVRRFLFAALSLSVVLPALAETVQLRRNGNATVIAFEYITQDETTIMVKRLDADVVLTYRWEESTAGPPRKYYKMTQKGQDFYLELARTWQELQQAVQQINQTKTHE